MDDVKYKDELLITETAHNIVIAEKGLRKTFNVTFSNMAATEKLVAETAFDKREIFAIGEIVYAEQFCQDGTCCYVLTDPIVYSGVPIRFACGGLPIEVMREMRQAYLDTEEMLSDGC